MPFVRERQAPVEQRSVSYGDPNQLPPFPGMSSNGVGIPVNETTVRSLEIVQTALDVISAGLIKRGNLFAYTWEMEDNLPFKAWSAFQPPILQDTFLYDGPLTNGQSRGITETATCMALFGCAWWRILGRDGNGDANYVETLFPPLVDIRVVNGQRKYFYGLGAQQVELDPSQLVYIPTKSLPAHQRPLSSITEAAPIYGVAMAAMKFGTDWFSTGSHTNMMISAKGEATQSFLERIARHYMGNHSVSNNPHAPLVVDQDTTATPLAVNPEDSQMTGTLTYARSAIASMFHLPFFMVDPGSGAPFATYEEVTQLLEDTLWTNYVVPIEEATSKLLRPGLQAGFTSDLTRPNSVNLAQKLNAVKASDTMTPNQMRQVFFGLPPLDQAEADMIAQPTPFQQSADAPATQPPESSNGDQPGAGN